MNRKKEGGGILMAIRKELYGSTIIVDMEEKDGDMIWIVIDNHIIKIRIGVIYAPQESRTMISLLKKMYNKITRHVQAAKDNNQNVLIVGDFNAKIGREIKGNTDEISKAGKLLTELADKSELSIINAWQETQGLWTRVEKKKRSVLDYLLISKEDEHNIIDMTIDEEKIWAMYRTKGSKEIYTDHNAIIATVNRYQAFKVKIESNKYATLNNKEQQMFKNKTENSNLGDISEQNEHIEILYSKWEEKIIEIINESFTIIKKHNKYTNKNKQMQTLMGIKRDIIKKIYKGSNTEDERIILQQRERLINEHMNEVNRKCFTQRITNTANEIKEGGGVNSGKFWEFKRKLAIKKKEVKIAMKDEDGKLQEDIEINKIIFEKFYRKLLTLPEPRNEKEMSKIYIMMLSST